MAYDRDNPFAKILRGEIPSDTVYEDDTVKAFNDITPQRPVHVLVIPKGEYSDLTEFAETASDAEIAGWVRGLARAAKEKGVTESGYRVIVNTGADGGQEVDHLHGHVMGGAPVGPMVKKQ